MDKKSRHCTDLPFAMVFILFLIGLIAIALYAFAIGSPLRMIHGSDSFGNVCGQQNPKIDNLPFTGLDLRKRPNLFHLNQYDPINTIKICVKKCPNRDLVNMAEIYAFYTRYNASLCRYDFDFNSTLVPSISSQSSTFNRPQASPTSAFNDSGLCPTMPVTRK